MRRLRHGEWLALLAAIALLVVLGLEWFGEESGYDGLGVVVVALVVAVALGGIVLAAVTVRGRPQAWPVAAAVLTSGLGILVWPVLVIRTLVFGAGDDDVAVWGWIGILLAALVPLGSWLAMGDERKSSRESAYTPPPPRPIPGSGTGSGPASA